MHVSMRVLKIMGIDTMANIVQYAFDNLPSEPAILVVNTTLNYDSSASVGTGSAVFTVDNNCTKSSDILMTTATPLRGDSPLRK